MKKMIIPLILFFVSCTSSKVYHGTTCGFTVQLPENMYDHKIQRISGRIIGFKDSSGARILSIKLDSINEMLTVISLAADSQILKKILPSNIMMSEIPLEIGAHYYFDIYKSSNRYILKNGQGQNVVIYNPTIGENGFKERLPSGLFIIQEGEKSISKVKIKNKEVSPGPLWVVNGVITKKSPLPLPNWKKIINIDTLKAEEAMAIYGILGRGGAYHVIVMIKSYEHYIQLECPMPVYKIGQAPKVRTLTYKEKEGILQSMDSVEELKNKRVIKKDFFAKRLPIKFEGDEILIARAEKDIIPLYDTVSTNIDVYTPSMIFHLNFYWEVQNWERRTYFLGIKR